MGEFSEPTPQNTYEDEVMKKAYLIAAFLCVLGRCWAEDSAPWTGSAPIMDAVPSSPAELSLRVSDPSLKSFAREAEVVDAGYQSFVLGEKIPVGPADHTPWARPLAGGPVRLTVISELSNNHDIAEIIRRLDCEVTHVTVPAGGWWQEMWPEAFSGYFTAAALEALKKPADVLLITAAVRPLPPGVAQAVAAKVEAGCGLVLPAGRIYGGGGPWGLWPLEANLPEPWKRLALAQSLVSPYGPVTTHQVSSPTGLFDGVPWEVLPPYWLGTVEVADGAEIVARDGDRPLAWTGAIGQGRAVVLAWCSGFSGVFPTYGTDYQALVADYQDYHASAAIRAILLAAGRSTATPKIDVPATIVAGQAFQVKVSASDQARVEMRVRGIQNRTVIPPRKVAGPIDLPALAAGPYLADLIVRDAKGASLGWGSYVLNVTAPAELTVTLDKPAYDPGRPARVEARIEHAPAGPLAARLYVQDTLGRLLFDAPADVKDGRAEWTYPNREPLVTLHDVDVVVTLDGKPYLAARQELYAPRFTWDDFTNVLWPTIYAPYACERVLRRMREDLGIELLLCGAYASHAELNRRTAASGGRPLYTNIAVQSPVETERNPEAVRQEVLKNIEETWPQIAKFGAAAVLFQDERGDRGQIDQPTPEGLHRFRAWLRGRYPDIAALNRAWGRGWTSFDEVIPALTKEFDPTQEASLAPWLEWRLWAMHEIVEIDRAGTKLLRERLGREAFMGLEGVFPLQEHMIPYGGLDVAAQSRDCFNTMWPYNNSMMNLCRSFYPGPSTGWQGYGSPYPVYERHVWEGALQGRWGAAWFCGSTFYHPFDWYYPQARWVRDLTRPLREGIGKLFIENSPIVTEPIAFLYSQPSLYALCVLGKTVDPNNIHLMVRPMQWARESLQKMFLDAGVQFGWVSEQDLQEGHTRGARVLVLTSCVALAPETCRALEKFVADGGIVFADLDPGVWDDHGTYHQPGQLDSLFGVKRDSKFQIRAMPADWGVGTFEDEPDFSIKGQWLIGQYYEKTLRAADGHALGKHIFGTPEEQAPAFVFMRHGKGAAILTNYLETEYRRVPESWQKVVLKALLQFAQIQPQVVLRDMASGGTLIDEGVIISRWKDGAAEYYGMILEHGRKTRIELPREGYLYELVRGQYLGHGKQADLDLRDHAYAVIALMPHQVGDLKLTCGKATLGEGLPLKMTLTPGGPEVKHVVHLTVLRPDGREYFGLSRNVVVKNGNWESGLPLALNDPAGPWRVKAREVVSGATSEATVKVIK